MHAASDFMQTLAILCLADVALRACSPRSQGMHTIIIIAEKRGFTFLRFHFKLSLKSQLGAGLYAYCTRLYVIWTE